MEDPLPPPSHILIVGAGEFGLSTTLALLRRPAYSSTRITILDSSSILPNPSGSSVDSNRIIRADYANPAYAKLAIAAQQLWRDTSPEGWGGQGRYYEPGFVLTCDKGSEHYLRKSHENVKSLATKDIPGLDPSKVEALPDKDALRRASGYQGVSGDSGYVNWSSGWADAEACIAYAFRRVQREGKGRVVLRSGCKVSRLLRETCGGGAQSTPKCAGVELVDGTKIEADLTILATGAWTPLLIDLRGRAIATGQALAYIDITDDEQMAMENRPTVMNMSQGIFIIPPRSRELKIARHGYGYRNPTTVALPTFSDSERDGRLGDGHAMEVSMPVVGIPIPADAERACRQALQAFVPSMADREFARTRICWYCDTPDGNFLIDYHPDVQALFIATGGSGHGFKFFPVIGDRIVDAMHRELDLELAQMWRWRETPVQDFTYCEDGSRAGPKDMLLEVETGHS